METIEEKRTRFKAKYNARKAVIDKLNNVNTARLRRKLFKSCRTYDTVFTIHYMNLVRFSAEYAITGNDKYASDIYELRHALRGSISTRTRALTCAYLHSINPNLPL